MSNERRKNTKTPGNGQGHFSGPPNFLVVEYNGRKVAIPRSPIYQETVLFIKRNIKDLRVAPNDQIVLLAHLEEVDDYVQITEDVWADLSAKLTSFQVEWDNEFDVDPLAILSTLRGKKPVIYLFPQIPTTNIRVQLSLARSWTFSEIYPPTTIETCVAEVDSLGQTIAWTVNAQPDGELFDQATGREVAYLFWEAQTKPKLLASPPTTRSSSPISAPSHIFDPASPILLPSHSVLLPFDKITGYLDDALLALGLHTEARTSFITYWLPDLSKHAYIALRFLPQDEYEQAAPLDVTPAPEVKTRVFMLFRGVAEDQVALWSEAAATTRQGVTMWRDVVGIDIEKVHDKSLFRVLEWGGMEVK